MSLNVETLKTVSRQLGEFLGKQDSLGKLDVGYGIQKGNPVLRVNVPIGSLAAVKELLKDGFDGYTVSVHSPAAMQNH